MRLFVDRDNGFARPARIVVGELPQDRLPPLNCPISAPRHCFALRLRINHDQQHLIH
jgi:hypothetical protein